MMRKNLLLLTMVAAILHACISGAMAGTDPISAVGHGAIFDAQGNEIDPSPEFVTGAQRFYLERLYRQANDRQRAEFEAKQQRLQEVKGQTKAEQIVVNSALIDWLIEAVKPQDAAHLTSKNTALLSRFARIADGKLSTKRVDAGELREGLLELLKREGLLTFLSATQAGGQAYLVECRQAGVPIPPDWGNPSWQSQGMLATKFISQGLDAELFALETERGVCFALPRSAGDTISLLGVICLGTETSKSCFWDNQKNKQQFDIPKNTSVPLSEFAGGADLYGGTGGVCTDCHAGENPFVVHPYQPMDLGSKLIPKNWQNPLVHPSWPQNPGPTNVLQGIVLNAGEDSCLACHNAPPGRRFPDVSTQLPNYCKIILPKAISFTMPPYNPGNNATFAKHKDALLAACSKVSVVINGGTESPPKPGRSVSGGDLTTCPSGGNCPLGFCYWRTLHGPFWQTTLVGYPDQNWRGSFARIYSQGGIWKWETGVDPSGGPPQAEPGGIAECVRYDEIVTVPDPKNCFANLFAVSDPDGTHLSQTVNATVMGSTANVLAGFIGNVAQLSPDPTPDRLQVFEGGPKVLLEQSHSGNPSKPFKPGPLTGESWTNGCNAWTPVYAAKDVFSTSDVQLVPSPQSSDVRCFITGITGGWSSTSSGGTVQPFAEIYTGPTGDLRLRTSVTLEAEVGAYASCIRLK